MSEDNFLFFWRKAACNFSLLVQRKVTKRKDPLRFARFAGSLRFSPSLALTQTRSLRSLKQGFAFPNEGCDARLHRRDKSQKRKPSALIISLCHAGLVPASSKSLIPLDSGIRRNDGNLVFCLSFPSALAEHRRDFAIERAVSKRPKGASLASAQNTEERKGPRVARRGIGGPFFSSLFIMPCGCFGQAKKSYTQPSARK
jgi:hypothetical protein